MEVDGHYIWEYLIESVTFVSFGCLSNGTLLTADSFESYAHSAVLSLTHEPTELKHMLILAPLPMLLPGIYSFLCYFTVFNLCVLVTLKYLPYPFFSPLTYILLNHTQLKNEIYTIIWTIFCFTLIYRYNQNITPSVTSLAYLRKRLPHFHPLCRWPEATGFLFYCLPPFG